MNCDKCKFYLCIDLPYCSESVFPHASPLAAAEIRKGLAGDCDKFEPRESKAEK